MINIGGGYLPTQRTLPRFRILTREQIQIFRVPRIQLFLPIVDTVNRNSYTTTERIATPRSATLHRNSDSLRFASEMRLNLMMRFHNFDDYVYFAQCVVSKRERERESAYFTENCNVSRRK